MACRLGSPAQQAAFGGEPAAPGALDDLVSEIAQAAAVEAVGRGIFLDDAFELGQRAVQAGRARAAASDGRW